MRLVILVKGTTHWVGYIQPIVEVVEEKEDKIEIKGFEKVKKGLGIACKKGIIKIDQGSRVQELIPLSELEPLASFNKGNLFSSNLTWVITYTFYEISS